jgi:hypothetical protein
LFRGGELICVSFRNECSQSPAFSRALDLV